MPHYIIGIDGGGTSCRAAVADTGGHILGRGKSGAANILTDPDLSLTNIINAARMAFDDAGLDPAGMHDAFAVVGVAGSDIGDVARSLRERLPFAASDIVSDGLIALEGALGDRDGGVAILGTGTIYLARQAGRLEVIGGRGFIIGDLGSGARLGQALLQESVLAFDRIRPSSPLTDMVMADFDNDARAVVAFARNAVPGDFGRYAPAVFTFAGQQDPVATALLDGSVRAIDEALDALVALGSQRLYLLGGLASLYQSRLGDRHRRLLMEPEADALTGAVALASRRASIKRERQA